MVDITVIIPAYNEVSILEETIRKVIKTLKEMRITYEIMLAENGSANGTPKLCEKIANNTKYVNFTTTLKGRGIALKNAISLSQADIVMYMDADLSSDLKHTKEMLWAIKEGYDIVTGARLLEGSRVYERRFHRTFLSKAYNFMVRILLGSKLHDHQCGFKAFKRDKIIKLLPDIKDNAWFFDTEILVKAQKKGYKVKEVPITWTDDPESKVNVLNDIYNMGNGILRVLFGG